MKTKLKHFLQLSKIALKIIQCKLKKCRIPITVSFHITNKCNLRCTYCYSNINNRFEDNLEDFKTQELMGYIKEMRELGTRWVILLGGEPLMRNDIGELVDFIKNENILCEIVTNGVLIPHKIMDIKKADLLCVSLDGPKNLNDVVRGKGSYEKAVKGLSVSYENRMKTRIHAVLTRFNNNSESIYHLWDLADEFNTTFGFSTPIINDLPDSTSCLVDPKEGQDFWRLLLDMKKKGAPIYNTKQTIKKMIQYSQIPLVSNNITKFDCFAGNRFCYVDSEGYVYPCIANGIKNGLNIKDVGFKEAWDALDNFLCTNKCTHIQYLEANDIMNLRFHSIGLGLKTIR